jgi:outer membrane protein assembly factor BamD
MAVLRSQMLESGLCLVLFMAIITGCSSKRQLRDTTDADFFYNQGMKYMEDKDYTKAHAEFQTVVDSYAGNKIVDSAQFMLAESLFMNEDYVTAAYEYERVFKDYPSSQHAAEAMFKRAVCYYHESPKASLDQENTQLAIDDFNRFIETYPMDDLVKKAQGYIDDLREKLAYKEFQNAELYRKLKKYDSAIIYYRFVIQDYSRTVWADEARYGIGIVYMKQKQYEKAREQFQALTTGIVILNIKERARKKLDYIENQTK